MLLEGLPWKDDFSIGCGFHESFRFVTFTLLWNLVNLTGKPSRRWAISSRVYIVCLLEQVADMEEAYERLLFPRTSNDVLF